MSFREKRALITLLALWIVVIGYVAAVLHAPPSSIPAAVPGMFGAMFLLIGIMIVSHIALIIGVGPKEARMPSDERERLAQLASRRNVSWVGQVGLWLILMLAIMTQPHVLIAQAALGTFVLAEIVMYASELFYYRRGV